MTAMTEFDRVVTSWLDATGPADIHAAAIDAALATARRTHQRRGLRGVLFGGSAWPVHGRRPVFATLPPTVRVVILLALALAALVGALLVGSQLMRPREIGFTGRVAYIRDGNVYLDDPGRSPITLLDDPAVDFTRVTWLEDRQRVAVEGGGVITVIDTLTGERRRAGPAEGPLTWWSGGNSYAYAPSRDGVAPVIEIVDANTGQTREVRPVPPLPTPANLWDLTWSGDGRIFAAFDMASRRFLLIDASTGATTIVAPTDPTSDDAVGGFSWSPDSSRLAFVEGRGGRQAILVADRDGSAVAQVTEFRDDPMGSNDWMNLGGTLRPTWSPDGAWIAFRAAPGLSLVRPDGRDRRDLVATPVGWFAWAADSSGLAFTRISSLDAAAGDLTWIATGTPGSQPQPLGLSGVAALGVVAPPPGGQIPAASPGPTGAPAMATPTPDASAAETVATPRPASPADAAGSWTGLAYTAGTDVCQTAHLLAFATDVPSDLTPCVERALVSPDGQRIATFNHGTLAVSRLGGRARVVFADGENVTWDWVDWSPGGRWLTGRLTRSDVTPPVTSAWVTAADGSASHELPKPHLGTWDLPTWSPDDRRLAIATENNLLVGNGDGSGLHPVGPFPPVGAWSPDGGQFAYLRDGDVWIAGWDGTGARDLTRFEFGGTWQATWSPAGDTLAVIQGNVLWLVKLDGSRSRVGLDPGLSLDTAVMRWSPDGVRMALEAGGAIYLVAADGSSVVRLDGATNPSWSPDSRFLASQGAGPGNTRLAVANADGSGRRPFGPSLVQPGGPLVWVP